MLFIVTSAQIRSVINEGVAGDFFIEASAHGWSKDEPSLIAEEEPKLFEQLVFRDINEDEISLQKGAELLNLPYYEVKTRCCFDEVTNGAFTLGLYIKQSKQLQTGKKKPVTIRQNA